MKMRFRKLPYAAAVAMAATSALTGGSAMAQVLNFAGLNGASQEQVNTYYDGGSGSLGSTGGTNYGISFSGAITLCDANLSGCSGSNVSQIPGGTGANSIIFLSGPGDVMNVAKGFNTGFSFDYTAPFYTGAVNVYSGLNGTGTLLATLNLATTNNGAGTPGCGGFNYCPFVAEGVSFAGTAESAVFTGTANYIAFADVTLGSSTVGGGTSAPEIDPNSAATGLLLLLGGLVVLRGRKSPVAA
jgi:hypothetical protein